MRISHGIPLLALAAGIQTAYADVTANPDSATTTIGQAIEIDVSANDTFTGNFYTISDEFPVTTSQGGVIDYPGYGGVLFYQPPADFTGQDTYTYFADDGTGYGDSATVTISVRASDDEGPIESAVTGTNNKQTGKMLDGLCTKVAGDDTADISSETLQGLNELCSANSDELNDLVSEITPEEILVLRHMMSNISQGHTQRVYQHQDALRTGRNSSNLAVNGKSLMLENYRGGSAGDADSSRWGIFGSVHSDNAEHDQTDFESEYDSTGFGVTVGMDYRLSPTLFVGGAIDWSNYDVEYKSNAGDVESDMFNLTGFVTWFLNDFSFDMQLGYASGDFDTKRNITFPTAAVAKGSTSSDQYNLSLQTDWTKSMDALTLRPFLRVDYMTTTIDGYTESGGGAWAMEVGSQDVDQVTTSLGLDTSYAMGFNWGVFVPGLKISAVSEASSDYSPVVFQLVGVATDDGAFELQPDTEDSLFYQYDLNAVFVLKNGWSTFVSGQFISGYDDFSTYIISGGVRMEM